MTPGRTSPPRPRHSCRERHARIDLRRRMPVAPAPMTMNEATPASRPLVRARALPGHDPWSTRASTGSLSTSEATRKATGANASVGSDGSRTAPDDRTTSMSTYRDHQGRSHERARDR
jgi:hypothetical protein